VLGSSRPSVGSVRQFSRKSCFSFFFCYKCLDSNFNETFITCAFVVIGRLFLIERSLCVYKKSLVFGILSLCGRREMIIVRNSIFGDFFILVLLEHEKNVSLRFLWE
jgi:hypothetical protein